LPLEKGIVGAVFLSKTPLNIINAYQDPRFYSHQDNITGITTRDLVCVPILDPKNEVFAIVQVQMLNVASYYRHIFDIPYRDIQV
jgi:hypothetical protein